MKEYLRVLPLPVLIFSVLTFLDISTASPINWISNLLHAVILGAIGCVGQYLIHRNILQDSDDNSEDDGCLGCGKPE